VEVPKPVVETKGRKRSKKRSKKEKQLAKGKAQIENNIYTILFDELSLFNNELAHMSFKALKQKLILLDGKMLWLEHASEIDLVEEEGSDDIIDMELQMLEMGYELETADEMKDAYAPIDAGFDLEALKDDLKETKSWGDDLKELISDIASDNPLDELASKFILYDLRAMLERAVNEVFRLEGKIKKMPNKEESEKQLEQLHSEQKKAVKSSLKDMLGKLKKEKPKLVMDEEKITEFRNLTAKQIIEIKAKEEKNFDRLVNELLE